MTPLERTISAIAAVTLALSVLAMAPSAGAAGAERIPAPLACFDVTDGTDGHLTNNVDSDPVRRLLGTSNPTTTTVDFTIALAAPSCTDGTYRIQVFDNDGAGGGAGTPRADAKLPGNGTTSVGTSFTFSEDADQCVVVQVTTATAKGRVIDLAPDDGDGLPLGPGCPGGGSVWK